MSSSISCGSHHGSDVQEVLSEAAVWDVFADEREWLGGEYTSHQFHHIRVLCLRYLLRDLNLLKKVHLLGGARSSWAVGSIGNETPLNIG